MSRVPHLTLWRLSLLLAVALISASLWLSYEMVQFALFLAGVADFFGRQEAIQWENIALSFVIVGLPGILLPSLYIAWAWRRAFPRHVH